MDIVVLAGGLSPERDVSLKTGEMVAQALRKNGHRVILTDVFMGYLDQEEPIADPFAHADEISIHVGAIPETAPDLDKVRASRKGDSNVYFGPNVLQLCRKADMVFIGLHGEDGENGKVQATLDLFGVRYTGSDYLGCAIAMNKAVTKQFYRENGVPTPRGVAMKKQNRVESFAQLGISLPCVVKPCSGGSSIGVTIVRDEQEFQKALDEAFAWEEELVIEEYISGREFSVAVLDGKALPIIEIAPIEGFYDYKNKYKAGSAVETCPADLPADLTAQMQQYAEIAAKSIGLTTYSRTDFLVNDAGEIYCLETNTLPGMTPTSLMPQEAAAVGISFEQLCEKILEISMKKLSVSYEPCS